MNNDILNEIKELLKIHEGFCPDVYEDTTGHRTIGYGRNLEDRPLSKREAEFLLEEDIKYFHDRLSKHDWFNELDNTRKVVITDMCFNLGLTGLLRFKKMIACLKVHDYDGASVEMLDSRWANQVKTRAVTLSKLMRS